MVVFMCNRTTTCKCTRFYLNLTHKRLIERRSLTWVCEGPGVVVNPKDVGHDHDGDGVYQGHDPAVPLIGAARAEVAEQAVEGRPEDAGRSHQEHDGGSAEVHVGNTSPTGVETTAPAVTMRIKKSKK